jgi:RND family efflux transporter MFP subunit
MSLSYRLGLVLVVGAVTVAYGRETPVPAQAPPEQKSAAARAIDVVRVIEQPLAVTLSIPGELKPYEIVAIYPRVTGFVKSVAVDRGSRVRTGQVLATLDAPELVAQRAEAQSKLQAAESQVAAVRAKADASLSTYEKLKAAAATPGVVAGNDLVIAQKGMDADASQVTSAQQSVEAARQALAAVQEMEGYLRIVAPFDGVVTERNIHPGALVGPSVGGNAMPMLQIVQEQRLRLVVPVPESYIAGVMVGAVMPFSVAAYPGEKFSGTVARVARSVDVQTRTICPSCLACASVRSIPPSSERQHCEHDRSYFRDPCQRRTCGMGRRQHGSDPRADG